jgi:DNA-binding transcriptional LysR family regulator
MIEHRVVGYESALTFVPQLRWLAATGARVALRVTDTLALATAIEEGIGLGVLPCFVGDARPSLVRVPFAGVHRERIWAVVPTELKSAPGVRAMLDFVVAAFKTEAAALAGRG